MVTLFRRLTGAWIIWDMDHDIRYGELSPQLLKPLHPVHHLFTRVVANKPLQIVLVVPPIALASLLLGAHYDLSPASLLFTFVATWGGLLIEFLVQLVIGTTAFWITQAVALSEVWFWMRAFFSGWIIPIAVFPAVIALPLQVLPFRYCLSFPIEIILGRLTLDQILFGLSVQYAWVVVLIMAFRLLWRRGLKLYGAVGA
jgi:ABC-2 type transport system permease protein